MTTGNSSLIIPGTITRSTEIKTIQFGNGNSNSDQSCKIQFNGVQIEALIVPGLHKNLLSVGQFCADNNASAVFLPNYGKLILPEARVIPLKKMNGIFYISIDKPAENERCFVSEIHNDSSYLWHCRFAHCSLKTLHQMIPETRNVKSKFLCVGCAKGKLTSKKHKLIEHLDRVLEKLQADLILGFPTSLICGYKVLLVILDVASRKMWTYSLKQKSDTAAMIKDLIIREQRQLNMKVLHFFSDSGTEFINNELDNFFRSQGITQKHTATNESASNGLVEKGNRTIEDKGRCLLHTAQLSEKLWPYAMKYATYIYNRTIHSSTSKTPDEAYYGEKSSTDKIFVWGSIAFAKDTDPKTKMSPRGKRGLFMGIDDNGLFEILLLDDDQFRVVSFRTIEIFEMQFLPNDDPNAKFLKHQS
jgi:uncharacterized protein (DUF2164 family)